MNMNLLYGEIAGSWLLHLAIPIIVSVILNAIGNTSLVLFVVLSIVASCILQLVFLITLQSSSCGGIQDMASVGVGVVGSSLLTGAMVAIPLYIEPMRLMVSQLVIAHKSITTPDIAREDAALSAGIHALTGSATSTSTVTGLSHAEYAIQTWNEQVVGASYWAAFAGAYGVALSSLFVTRCSKSKNRTNVKSPGS